MSPVWFSARIPFLGGVIAVVALCALAVPETAHAACGDWLENHSVSTTMSTTATRHSWTQDEAAPLLPCSGPGCRQAPRPEMPGIPDRIMTEQQERACIIIDGDLHAAGRGRLLPSSQEIAPPEIMRDRIDRPPRA